jgi:hypothetical protein
MDGNQYHTIPYHTPGSWRTSGFGAMAFSQWRNVNSFHCSGGPGSPLLPDLIKKSFEATGLVPFNPAWPSSCLSDPCMGTLPGTTGSSNMITQTLPARAGMTRRQSTLRSAARPKGPLVSGHYSHLYHHPAGATVWHILQC